MNVKRNRLFYLLFTFIVMVLGLASRKFAAYFPDLINLFLGDALWALMIFLLFAVLLKNLSIGRIALLGLVFCYLIEISQLYHSCWIDSIRNTQLGALVLGAGFLWTDLLAYAIGIGCGIVGEWFYKRCQT